MKFSISDLKSVVADELIKINETWSNHFKVDSAPIRRWRELHRLRSQELTDDIGHCLDCGDIFMRTRASNEYCPECTDLEYEKVFRKMMYDRPTEYMNDEEPMDPIDDLDDLELTEDVQIDMNQWNTGIGMAETDNPKDYSSPDIDMMQEDDDDRIVEVSICDVCGDQFVNNESGKNGTCNTCIDELENDPDHDTMWGLSDKEFFENASFKMTIGDLRKIVREMIREGYNAKNSKQPVYHDSLKPKYPGEFVGQEQRTNYQMGKVKVGWKDPTGQFRGGQVDSMQTMSWIWDGTDWVTPAQFRAKTGTPDPQQPGIRAPAVAPGGKESIEDFLKRGGKIKKIG